MLKALEGIIHEFEESSRNSAIRIISHYDTDGITSAAIMARALQREDKKFSVTIVKQLETSFIEQLKKSIGKNQKEMLIFLDLGSSSLEMLSEIPADIFVFDHHEIKSDIKTLNSIRLRFINPHLFNEEVSAAGVVYLFAKLLLKPDHYVDESFFVLQVITFLQMKIKWNKVLLRQDYLPKLNK